MFPYFGIAPSWAGIRFGKRRINRKSTSWASRGPGESERARRLRQIKRGDAGLLHGTPIYSAADHRVRVR